jgi:hypothetical protein
MKFFFYKRRKVSLNISYNTRKIPYYKREDDDDDDDDNKQQLLLLCECVRITINTLLPLVYEK